LHHTKKIQFGNAVKELCRYRGIYVDQEKPNIVTFTGISEVGGFQPGAPRVPLLVS
jgi:hypothetical protein